MFEFHPSFSFTEEYTDNFHLASGSSPRTSNFRSTASAGFSLLINAPKTTGSISTSMSASIDSSSSEPDANFFPTFAGTVRHVFNPRLSVTVTDALTRSDEPSLVDTTGLRRERRIFTSNTFSISADWLLDLVSTQAYYRNSLFFSRDETISHIFGVTASTRLGELNSLSGGYELSLSNTSTDPTTGATGQQSSDSVGHLVHLSLSRRIGYFGSAGVSTSYALQSRDNTKIWNISVFSAYGLPTGLSLSSSLGYSRLYSDSGGDSNAITTNSTVSYRFTKAVISLGISQDYRQTFVEGQDFGIVLTRSAHASFSYPITPFIGTSVFATYSETEPPGSELFSISDRSAKAFTAGFSLSWPILRWLSGSLSYTFTERSGDASFVDPRLTGQSSSTGTIRENRATVTLSASF